MPRELPVTIAVRLGEGAMSISLLSIAGAGDPLGDTVKQWAGRDEF
jgi:hypothetical protein